MRSVRSSRWSADASARSDARLWKMYARAAPKIVPATAMMADIALSTSPSHHDQRLCARGGCLLASSTEHLDANEWQEGQ
jgi:hypothetical protein